MRKNSLYFAVVTAGFMIQTLSVAHAATHEEELHGFCKDRNQTQEQCVKQAEEAFNACQKGLEEGAASETSLNVTDGENSLKNCKKMFEQLSRWCGENCPSGESHKPKLP